MFRQLSLFVALAVLAVIVTGCQTSSSGGGYQPSPGGSGACPSCR